MPDQESEKKEDQPSTPKAPLYRRPAFLIWGSIIVVLVLAGALLYYLHERHFESTDDAYIDGHVTPISPRVSAPVRVLHINDNQFVHQGELLVELDPTDYQVAVAQAQAQLLTTQGRLSQAQAQVGAAKAAVAQATAQVKTAQVSLSNATRQRQAPARVSECYRRRMPPEIL